APPFGLRQQPPPTPTPTPARTLAQEPTSTPARAPVPVPLPADTVRAVRELVGPVNAPAFIAAAADREVLARRMDDLTTAAPAPPEPP
ncbi:hypothetical protein ACSNOD_17655, partial [Streptomyces sp. URMC 123]